jgi:hypothetical protein
MAGRVDLSSKRTKKGEYISNEHVGIGPAEPFAHALWTFTARADKEMARREKETVHKDAAPAESTARKVKAMSLFPSIYGKPHGIGPDA